MLVDADKVVLAGAETYLFGVIHRMGAVTFVDAVLEGGGIVAG